MRDMDWRMLSVAALLALTAGCKGGSEPSPAASPTPTEEGTVAALETGAATQAGGAPASFSVFVGKYPRDKVGDYAFFDHPRVQEGVARLVTDPHVLDAIAAMKGPVGPVTRTDNDIAASQCEEHNCGAHNYAIHVDATTDTVSAVCYYDEKAGPIATWYRPDGVRTSEGGGCSVG